METLVNVKSRTIADVMIFELSGELDETNADTTFTSLYSEIGDFSGKKLVFNLSGLTYLNSKSIGYIADIFSNIEENGGKMYLTNMNEEVRDTLELVGITSIVPVTETEEKALGELGI